MRNTISFLMLSVSLLLPAAAVASSCNGTQEILTVETWSYAPGEIGSSILTLSIMNNSDDIYRLINGHLTMVDVLDREVFEKDIPPDVNLAANSVSEVLITRLYIHSERLSNVNQDDVISTICLQAAVTSNGKKIVF